jgi:hypothetical protein
MRKWRPEEDLFKVTLPEARWTYSPPVIAFYRRKRTWKPEQTATKS